MPSRKIVIKPLFSAFFLIHWALAQPGKHPQKWQTLSGLEPLVIARGGFSGLFPHSTLHAFDSAIRLSLPNVALFCDLQFSKDNIGFCLPSLNLANSTNIIDRFPKGEKEYIVNGRPIRGWFSLDFTFDQLHHNISLKQNLFSRPPYFNGLTTVSVDELLEVEKSKPPQFWLNVEYPSFYAERKTDTASYIKKLIQKQRINYISSPEINFLKTLGTIVPKDKTKLVFRFLKKNEVEPTTKKTYANILRDLASIKSFASGILVTKGYIWPVNKNLYLEPATSLVADAHKLGLEVFASGFSNDKPASYNYSYDPTAEYLQFIDNGQFAVDGFLTDFPSTASESIACLAHQKKATRRPKGPLIISSSGASGEYPGSTDIAYEQAIKQGTDIIDCSVQISKDGVAFCSNSSDLAVGTNAQSVFTKRSTKVPEIQKNSGIFSFDLTWSEIQTLKPQLQSPFQEFRMMRNPGNNGKGKFLTLSTFLKLAKDRAVTGVLINIENARFLASKKGFSITDIVAADLRNAGFETKQTQKVLIQSADTQVLAKFKANNNYQKVFFIRNTVSAAPKATVDEIRKYADAVTVTRSSVVKSVGNLVASFTALVDTMKAAKLSVYLYSFKNEYIDIELDYCWDPMVEFATLIGRFKVDGVFTEFPATANAYLRSPCSDPSYPASEYSIIQIEPDFLLSLAHIPSLPPESPPAPDLRVQDVADPLPPVPNKKSTSPPVPVPKKKSTLPRVPVPKKKSTSPTVHVPTKKPSSAAKKMQKMKNIK